MLSSKLPLLFSEMPTLMGKCQYNQPLPMLQTHLASVDLCPTSPTIIVQYLVWMSKASEKWMAEKTTLFRLLYIILSFNQPLKANVSTVDPHSPKQIQIFYNIQEIHFSRNTEDIWYNTGRSFHSARKISSSCILSHSELKFPDFFIQMLEGSHLTPCCFTAYDVVCTSCEIQQNC